LRQWGRVFLSICTYAAFLLWNFPGTQPRPSLPLQQVINVSENKKDGEM
jgi:hypothetical protein